MADTLGREESGLAADPIQANHFQLASWRRRRRRHGRLLDLYPPTKKSSATPQFVAHAATCATQLRRTSEAATSDAGGNTIEVAELACAELGAIDQAWAAVVPEAVGVEDCTSQIGAMGGVQTYRVSASVAEGRVMKAVLRQWSGNQETAVEQRLFVQRWCAACRVFALHGVGPRRLAEQPPSPHLWQSWCPPAWRAPSVKTSSVNTVPLGQE